MTAVQQKYAPASAVVNGEYGVVDEARGVVVPCSRAELLHQCASASPPAWVQMPGGDAPVPPWQVPELLPVMRMQARLRKAGSLAIPLAGLSLAAPLGAVSPYLAAGSVALGLAGTAAWIRVAHPWRLTPADRERLRAALAAPAPVPASGQPSPQGVDELPARRPGEHRYALAVSLGLYATALMQLQAWAADSGSRPIPATALEHAWRLLASPVMHGPVLPFMATLWLIKPVARQMEERAPRGWLPVTFLLSALAGSAAEMAFHPSAPWIGGAAGGLLGLCGFLWVLSRRRPTELPAGSGWLSVPMLMVWMMFLGMLMQQPALAVAGFATGAGLGLLGIPDDRRVDGRPASGWLKRAGYAALAVLGAGAAAAAALLVPLM